MLNGKRVPYLLKGLTKYIGSEFFLYWPYVRTKNNLRHSKLSIM